MSGALGRIPFPQVTDQPQHPTPAPADPYNQVEPLPGITSGYPAYPSGFEPQARGADQMGSTALGDYIARQQAEAERLGLWDSQTGLPTSKGLVSAAQQYGQGLLLGTSGPEGSGIRAYHGSPYQFERFDPAHIGTGEGAQAYGHGLYFAERPSVAESYKTSRGTDYSTSTGGTIPDWLGNQISQYPPEHEYYAATIDQGIKMFQQRAAEARAELEQGAPQPWLIMERLGNVTRIADALQQLRSGDATLLPRGHMYEVNLQADPEHFLDWDKPLSQQSQHVQDAMAKIHAEDPEAWQRMQKANTSGSNLMESAGLSAEQQAQRLREAGIPGIRYLDQGSRAAGQGSSNYVVFDPNTINIIRRYGIAGLIAGGADALRDHKRNGGGS